LGAFQQELGSFLLAISYQQEANFTQLALNLLNNFPNFYLSYLAVAMAYQGSNLTSLASNYLQQANDSSNDQDFASLLPSTQEWLDQYPPQTLVNITADTWAVPYYYKNNADQPFSLFQVGYLTRLTNGSIVYFNPVPLSNDVLAQVKGQGLSPSWLIEITLQHYQFLSQVQAQFPEAQAWGVQAQQTYPPTSNLQWTGFLNDATPLFPSDFKQVTLNGQTNDECAFYNINSSTVFLGDFVFDSVISLSPTNYTPGTSNNQTSFF